MINLYTSSTNSFGKKSTANSQSSMIFTWLTSRMHLTLTRHLLITAFVVLVITQSGLAQPMWQSFDTSEGSSGSAVVDRPTGTVSGDLMVIGLMFEKGTDVAVTPPSGWTLILRTNHSTVIGMATYYKIAGGAEPTTYSFAMTNGPKWAIGNSRITGANTAIPINISGGAAGASGNPTAPSVTTTFGNTLVLAFFTNKSSSLYSGVNTERYDDPNSAGSLPSNMMATNVQVNAGSTPTHTPTVTSAEWCAQQIAITDASSCLTGTWLGATSSDWFEDSNWCNGIEPT